MYVLCTSSNLETYHSAVQIYNVYSYPPTNRTEYASIITVATVLSISATGHSPPASIGPDLIHYYRRCTYILRQRTSQCRNKYITDHLSTRLGMNSRYFSLLHLALCWWLMLIMQCVPSTTTTTTPNYSAEITSKLFSS